MRARGIWKGRRGRRGAQPEEAPVAPATAAPVDATLAWPPAPVAVTLQDGTTAVIRAIDPDGAAALAEGFARLSPESRYQRFLGPRDHLTPQELEFLTHVDGVHHLALVMVVTVPDRAEPLPVAVARCVRDPADPETAEPAIAVADDWQGRGVGTLLLRELAGCARQAGIRRWRALLLAENHAMRKLLARVGRCGRPTMASPGVMEIVCELEEVT